MQGRDGRENKYNIHTLQQDDLLSISSKIYEKKFYACCTIKRNQRQRYTNKNHFNNEQK